MTQKRAKTEDHGLPHSERVPLGEHIENLLTDLGIVVVRYGRTVVLLALRPRHTIDVIRASTSPPVLIRPHTFLFIACLLYSFVLSGYFGDFDSYGFPLEGMVLAMRDTLSRDFSFPSLVLRSIPLMFVFLLFAWLAQRIFGRRSPHVKKLFLYLYGLQCSTLILFVLSSPAVFMFSNEDSIAVLLILGLSGFLTIQGYRHLNLLLSSHDDDLPLRKLFVRWSTRFALFGLLFIPALPLAGYVSLLPSSFLKGIRSQRIPPVRITDVEDLQNAGTQVSARITIAVENTGTRALVVHPKNIHVALYFSTGINIFSGEGNQDLEDAEQLVSIVLSDVRIDDRSSTEGIALAPGASGVLQLSATTLPQDQFRYHDLSAMREANAALMPPREFSSLSLVSREAFVRISIDDPTSLVLLHSNFVHVESWP